MSQIEDIRPSAMGRAASTGNAAKATQPGQFHNLSDGDLADAHRGQTFALERAKTAKTAIEAELARRGVTTAQGKLALTTQHQNDGLIDLKKLRAEMGDAFCKRFALANSETYWRSRTLTDAERAAPKAGG